MKMIKIFFISLLVFPILCLGSDHSEEADLHPLDYAKMRPLEYATLHRVDDAVLYRVEKGLFHLKENQSIDVTDRYLLLTLRNKHCLEIIINSRTACIEVGNRYDLKSTGQPFDTGKLFSDRKRCFLDIVKIDAPQGAIPSVTFRLHCI